MIGGAWRIISTTIRWRSRDVPLKRRLATWREPPIKSESRFTSKVRDLKLKDIQNIWSFVDTFFRDQDAFEPCFRFDDFFPRPEAETRKPVSALTWRVVLRDTVEVHGGDPAQPSRRSDPFRRLRGIAADGRHDQAILLAASLPLLMSWRTWSSLGRQRDAAPWNPTQKLVVQGVYRHVRRPSYRRPALPRNLPNFLPKIFRTQPLIYQ